jgi:hypothetical protein
MQAIIKGEIEKTLDMRTLQGVVPRYARVIKYDKLKGKTLTEIFGRYTVLIILWNIHDTKNRVLDQAGHFFVLSRRGPESEKLVVFSSTGMTPKEELFATHSDPKLLINLLPKDTVVNKMKLQTNRKSNTCWRYAILFTKLAPMGLKSFQKLFRRPLHLMDPDQIVTALTLTELY